jgi:sulfide:quinone oxidoreductase
MTRTRVQRDDNIHVLIAGGGVAALETALALRALGDHPFDVELVAPEHHFFYRPLAVAEPFDVGRVHRWELADLARAADASFTSGAAESVDVDAHTVVLGDERHLAYDVLVLACGARPEPAIPGAFTFRGPGDVENFARLVDDAKKGPAKRIVFAVPSGVVWPLPAYELALMTAHDFKADGVAVEIALVTSEPAPLALLGQRASATVEAALAERGIAVHAKTYAAEVDDGALLCVPAGRLEADRVVALPRLRGPLLDGVPKDRNDFVPTDSHGRVRGLDDVYAAGDVTTFPIKQGGLAAQQADVVAEAIAAEAGLLPDAAPFQPVLSALLLTGEQPLFLRVELGGGHGETSAVSEEPLWWPPDKIVGRHLAPFLTGLGLVDFPRKPTETDLRQIETQSAGWHERLWRPE